MVATERDRLRRQMRAQRRSLPPGERAAAAVRIARIAQRALLLRPGRRIAVYLAQGSEADLAALSARARQRGCRLHLPVIVDHRRHRMAFLEYRPRTALRVNRYGIAEPAARANRGVPVRNLDLILVPLVAVDPRGWRLGSGAGFYDRCLHHLRPPRRWRRPKLIGIAYELQRVPRLDPQPWDVPLDAILTERALHRAARALQPAAASP